MFFSKNHKRRVEYRNSFKDRYIVDNYYSSDYDIMSDLDFYVVSWNSPHLVDLQIRLFKKYCYGSYRYIICDNSTDYRAVQQIKSICEKHDVTYIRVLDTSIPYGYSNSHELALNWIYKNVIKKRKNNFAFLDHDIFPVKDILVNDCLGNSPVWGWYYENAMLWYSWAGFAFFSWNAVKDLPLNFHRHKLFGFISLKGKYWCDTGSGNWHCLYSKLDRNSVKPCEAHFENFETGEYIFKVEDGVPYCQYIDNKAWLHIFDGANRYKSELSANRVEKLLKYLENKLES